MKILTIRSNVNHKQRQIMYATKHSSPILACLPSQQNTLLAPSSAQLFTMSNEILASVTKSFLSSQPSHPVSQVLHAMGFDRNGLMKSKARDSALLNRSMKVILSYHLHSYDDNIKADFVGRVFFSDTLLPKEVINTIATPWNGYHIQRICSYASFQFLHLMNIQGSLSFLHHT